MFGPSRGTMQAFYFADFGEHPPAGVLGGGDGLAGAASSGSRPTAGRAQPVIGDVELEPGEWVRGLEAGRRRLRRPARPPAEAVLDRRARGLGQRCGSDRALRRGADARRRGRPAGRRGRRRGSCAMAVADPVVISCAVAGSIVTGNPNQPRTRDDVIDETLAAAHAGAAIVHVHARSAGRRRLARSRRLRRDPRGGTRRGLRRDPQLHDRRLARHGAGGAPALARGRARRRVAELRHA